MHFPKIEKDKPITNRFRETARDVRHLVQTKRQISLETLLATQAQNLLFPCLPSKMIEL